jgi:hypothetical protein
LKSWSHLGHLAAVLSLLAVCAFSLRGGADGVDALKCATLLAFVQNAHWMEQPAANSPLTVGVVGRTDFIRSLRAGLEGKIVDTHQLRILEISAPADPVCCQVLYFATDKAAQIKPVLQSFSSAHVLTVGESESFLDQGGAVNLFLMDGHMAFEVSLKALDRAGVEISSKLLRFGQIRDLAKGRPAK